MFNPRIFDLIEPMGNHLRSGGVVVVQDCLEREFVASLADELSSCTTWDHEEIHEHAGTEKEFRYTRDVIKFGSGKEPPILKEFSEFLRSDTCLDWVTALSQQSCFDFEGAAASLGPGDYLDKHTDFTGFGRTVTFNCYLSKIWNPIWGGELHFFNPPQTIPPLFNSMNLFMLTPRSAHEVKPISMSATERRMAVSGWFGRLKVKNPSELA